MSKLFVLSDFDVTIFKKKNIGNIYRTFCCHYLLASVKCKIVMFIEQGYQVTIIVQLDNSAETLKVQ